VTQEFHLSITSLGSDRYLIRTEDAAAGVPVAEAQVDWPVEEWLQLAKPAMDDPVAGLLQGHLDLSNRTSGLQQLGTKLYNALFQDEAIRESWTRAKGIAQFAHEILRLRLGLKESRLQRLPWEVLQQGGQPITTRTNLTFTRYAANFLVEPTAKAQKLPDAGASIHVLLVIASPQDQDHLKLLQEVRQVQELLATENGKTSPIRIDVLEQPDRSQLAHQLEQGNYQVLHYAGHSDFGQNGGDLSLVNRQTGLTEKLSGDDLAGLLVNNHVALTVFNSCRSGHTAGDDADMDWRQQNLVQALLNRGVPSVVAMAERIPDEVAIAFTRLFYHNLREGFPIDLSLSRTRQGLIAGFGSDQHYWALPILYLQPDFDGYLTKRDRDADDQLDPDALSTNGAEPLGAEPLVRVPPPQAPPSEPPVAASVPEAADLPEQAVSLPVSETVTTTLLSQLDAAAATEVDDDELLVDYVQQLSKSSTALDETLMPAQADEVLMPEESERAGLEIYDQLPEVTASTQTPPREAAPVAQTVSARDVHAQTATPQQLYTPNRRTASTRRQSTKPLFLWGAIGLVGAIGVLGLSFAAMRWANNGGGIPPSVTTPSTPSPEPASPDPFTLIRRAEKAITQDREADAREDFELALTQALMGKAELAAVSDAIWPWVSETDSSDLLYVKGRIAWQEIAQIESDVQDFESGYEQRTFARQAREIWERTDDTFLKGRIARGFAAYAAGDWDAAIANWDAALQLYDEQRQRLPDPAGTTLADPAILHAYAGLVMAHTTLGNINPMALEEDDRLQNASSEEQAILNADAEKELSLAKEYFLRLQELDERERMAPSQLGLVNESPHTWDNWLWTADLLKDWQRDYRYWQIELDSTLPTDSE
jgi:CHAT domain-containing protein/tetratricopeptide (TPR) repeat protein